LDDFSLLAVLRAVLGIVVRFVALAFVCLIWPRDADIGY
jgi:hypothetical protein